MPNVLLWLKHATQDAEFDRQTARIALEVGENAPELRGGVTAGGDERRLRGIPAIGRGVTGALGESKPGTDGHLAAIQRRIDVA